MQDWLKVALYPLSSPNHNLAGVLALQATLRYILFHHQTTTLSSCGFFGYCCVISSFITKPQRTLYAHAASSCCVISSFITKPQQPRYTGHKVMVALYPLSSPNHNTHLDVGNACGVALYPLSSPNHNSIPRLAASSQLRYILFHHQTTTPHP